MSKIWAALETIWINGVPPLVVIGGCLILGVIGHETYKNKQQRITIQQSKIIIPNITRDEYIDLEEKTDFHNMIDSFIGIYNGKQNKISSLADINGDGIIDSTEKAGLHKTIDSVIESYNTKSKMGAPKNNEKSDLYNIIDSVTKNYNSKKWKK